MVQRGWLYISVTALVAGLAATEACILERSGTCDDPGGCVREGGGGGFGPGGAGSSGGSAASCERDADCDDGNACTIDTCGDDQPRSCNKVNVGAGEVVEGTPTCLPLVCDGGGPDDDSSPAGQPAPAGTPCDGGGFCDGAGACKLPLALGGECVASAQCDSGHCVEGVCCEFACDAECQQCNLDTFDQCETHDPDTHDPDCGPNTVCNGGGECKSAGN